MPPKPELVFHHAPNVTETAHTAFNVELSPSKPNTNLSHTHRSSVPIIEDWISDLEDEYKAKKMDQTSVRKHAQRGNPQQYARMALPYPQKHVVLTAVLTKSKLVPITAARLVTVDVPKPIVTRPRPGNPQHALKDKGVIDSGCSLHMKGNMSYLSDFEELNGGYVAFCGNPKGGKISKKGKIRTKKLEFDDVYFVKELKFNLFSVSQMCDKKNNVLFTDTACLVLSSDFKLPDENQVLLRVPREKNMYNVDLKNIVPFGDLTCLLAKATLDESNPWHRRLGHINFITMNKLVTGNLVRGLSTKVFENDHTCVACKNGIENQLSLKVKIIQSNNGPELKNNDLNQFCRMKGIKRQFSVPRTPQQNGIAERKNRTLIEAARTMQVDSLLPIPFWAEAVNTACYVQNRVLVTKHLNKTPYELLLGRIPSIGFMRPFGCLVTILNTLDPLGKFDGKVDEGFLVGYSVSSKAFMVFNSRSRIVQETLHINFLENKPNVAGSGPTWLFDIDTLRKTMNYQAVTAGNQSNPNAGVQEQFDVEKAGEESAQQYVIFPVWSSSSTNPQNTDDDAAFGSKEPELEDITYSDDEEDVGAEADFTNLETSITISPIPTIRVHKYQPVTQIIGYLSLATQTRSMTRVAKDQGGLSQINNDDFHICMFVCFLSQEEPKRKVWVLVDLPHGKRDIGTKWVFRNKNDERGIVVRNKARLVTQGHTQEDGIDYEEVFAPVVRIEAIRLFLAYASFMGFMVYQMDVKSDFWYVTIEEEVYVCQPLRFEDSDHPDKIYVDDIIFGSTNKDLCKDFEKLMKDKFQMSSMGELTFFLGLQVKQKQDGLFITQDKYVVDILRKFGLTDRKLASTPIDTEKPLLKDPDGEDVDMHTYKSMIGSLMYLTSSRPDIMFAVCACARFQVTPKASHLNAVKRIFRYLKGKPHLGLWYPKDSPFNLVAYSDSDYDGASLDRMSTIGECQFLGGRLISSQCKK
uniref:Integrase catalytic domain-containing protein n=1 Tax=Tanacetum cinerariifolium TaxID=118510 RepID=A0A699HPD9_TANCI|nr:hypothetical protein [Tanacetum cinerariifolium]